MTYRDKSISVALFSAALLLMISCTYRDNNKLNIDSFYATSNPIPYDAVPTLKGGWTFDGTGWEYTGVIVNSDGSWQGNITSPPFLKSVKFETPTTNITKTTTYTLTVQGRLNTKTDAYLATKTAICTVDVAPQSLTVLLPSGDYLVVGGKSGEGLREVTTKVERWNAIEGWRTTGSLQVARMSPVVTSLPDGRALVYGGKDMEGNPVRSEEIYDPILEQWTIRE